eukprot:jgi/Psemu1/60392/gm1.60392_g
MVPPDPPNARITEAQRAYQIHQEGPTRLQGRYRDSRSEESIETAAPHRSTRGQRQHAYGEKAYLGSIHLLPRLPAKDATMRSYREFFQGDGPFGEAPARHDIYQAIYTLFNEADGDQLLPLLLDIFNAQAIGGLGLFQEDAAGVDRLRVIHGLRRYPGTITQPSANRGRAFGYIDDVEGQEVELVRVDAALLSRAAASRVYLLAHHEANVSQHPKRDYIPAIPEGTAHTEMLQAHKQAFQVLQPHIHQQGLGDICKPLLDTLRAVGTQPTTLMGAIRLLEPGPAFRAEANLRAYMKKNVLLRELSHESRIIPQPLPSTAAFSALTDQQIRLSESLDQRRQESSKAALSDLPPIYTAWAKKSKHEKTHMILQSQVATDAYNLGIQAPLITTAVLKRFQDCNFYGTDPFDVADGILPLAFTPPGGSAATLKREHEAAANVAAYDTMISTQGNSLSLKDSLELQKTKAYIPLDWTEATTQLKSYLAVLATLLGATHNVVKSYQRGLSRLEWQQMPLRRAIADEVGERITPALVVYYFQVRVRGWLEEQWESDTTLPSPDFGEDIHRFRMTQNLNWLPNVSNVDALRALQPPNLPPKGPSG